MLSNYRFNPDLTEHQLTIIPNMNCLAIPVIILSNHMIQNPICAPTQFHQINNRFKVQISSVNMVWDRQSDNSYQMLLPCQNHYDEDLVDFMDHILL